MPAPDLSTCYDYEHALEAAIKSVFTDAFPDASIYIPGDADEKTQLSRPRFEVVVEGGAATDHRSTHSEIYRCDSFNGSLSLVIITKADFVEHRAWRNQARAILGAIETTLSEDAAGADTKLPYHSLNRCVESGSQLDLKPEDGVMVSRLQYEIHFNIRPAAWPAD